MRIDRPRQGDGPDEGDRPDREPDKPQRSMNETLTRIAKANADQYRDRPPTADRESENRTKVDRLLKLYHGDKPSDDKADEAETADRLPNVEAVAVDRRKFVDFSMDPNNQNNKGKWKAWEALGYDVHDPAARRKASDEVTGQLQRRLPDLDVASQDDNELGTTYELRDRITGPNSKAATLRTFWLLDKEGTTPRLITNWAEIHTDRNRGGNQ